MHNRNFFNAAVDESLNCEGAATLLRCWDNIVADLPIQTMNLNHARNGCKSIAIAIALLGLFPIPVALLLRTNQQDS